MKRSTRSLTAIVERPARSSPSSISKTEASNRPDSRISASSAGVLTMSGDGRIREPDLRRGELHPDDLVEGQGRMGFGEHSDLHPIFGLRVDRAAHHRARPAGFFMQIVFDLPDAHWGVL